MSHAKKVTGIALAVAAAGMLGAATPVFADSGSADAKVHCYGVNKCKGHNDCKTADNACKGKGSCKGKGFVNESAKTCDKMGGKVGK